MYGCLGEAAEAVVAEALPRAAAVVAAIWRILNYQSLKIHRMRLP